MSRSSGVVLNIFANDCSSTNKTINLSPLITNAISAGHERCGLKSKNAVLVLDTPVSNSVVSFFCLLPALHTWHGKFKAHWLNHVKIYTIFSLLHNLLLLLLTHFKKMRCIMYDSCYVVTLCCWWLDSQVRRSSSWRTRRLLSCSYRCQSFTSSSHKRRRHQNNAVNRVCHSVTMEW